MAKNTLPEDFKDDILAESMNGRRRYQMISNADGTVSFVDVTEYSQVGSNFGQAQINATNVAVNESADKNKIIDSKEDLLANTQAGMMAGALAVKEIRSELNENLEKNTFGNQVTLVKDQNYICSSDGYFRIVCAYQEKSRAVGFINDIILVALSSTNSSSVVINNSLASIVFVRAGMTIKYTGTNAQGYFIPLI